MDSMSRVAIKENMMCILDLRRHGMTVLMILNFVDIVVSIPDQCIRKTRF